MANYSPADNSSSVDLDHYIGSRLKARRSALGISQEKLGSFLGVTFQQIQKYERGINRISASTLYRIACALSTDFSYFIEGYGGNSCLMDNDLLTYKLDNLQKKESVELLKHYYKIPHPTVRKKIVDIIRLFSAVFSIKDEQ
jgi:transcriptional regulator with XRE-family HTH domain